MDLAGEKVKTIMAIVHVSLAMLCVYAAAASTTTAGVVGFFFASIVWLIGAGIWINNRIKYGP